MAASQWCERLFGSTLIACSPHHHVSITSMEALADVDVVGVYFAFANVAQRCDELVRPLRDLYAHLNAPGARRKRLEVIQVVLWAHTDVYAGDVEDAHDRCLHGLPWYAMASTETERKTKLSRRFRIKSGVPTLVLLESRDGATISMAAQQRLLEDPTGTSFPWRPRPVDLVLADVQLHAGGASTLTTPPQRYADLSGVRGFYFSANWCPPCRAFTPLLAAAYSAIRRTTHDFQVVFVSSDRSVESYDAYVETMPWLSIPFQQAGVRAELAQLYGIRGIPTLLLLDGNSHLITMDARAELLDDPQAHRFPWRPKAVNVLTERFGARLHDAPAIVLFVDGDDGDVQCAESLLTPVANDYYATTRSIADDADDAVQFFIAVDSDAADVLRDLIGAVDDAPPLLAAIDLPRRRFALMEHTAADLQPAAIAAFVDGYARDALPFAAINDCVTIAPSVASVE